MTRREQEVLDLLCDGLGPQQIATRLHLSVSTVRGHVRSLITQYRAQSTQHLVCIEWARRARCECRSA